MSSVSHPKSCSTAQEEKQKYFKRPSVSISVETISKLIRAGVDPSVASIDLELVKLELKLIKGWSNTVCEVAELEYKRHLTLILWNKHLSYPIVPTVLVDEVWHKHILDTRAYHDDMEHVFGGYIHHFPFLGFIGEESKRLKEEAFILSTALYEETFGEPRRYSAKQMDETAKRVSSHEKL